MDLVGFLFGNVNSEGELEDDGVLDKVMVASLLVDVANRP